MLTYEMYDIAIVVTNTPDDMLLRDPITLSFRLSYLNDEYLAWYATVRLFCLILTSAFLLVYFFTSCSCKGINVHAFHSFTFQ